MANDLVTLAAELAAPAAQVLLLVVLAWTVRRLLHRLVRKAVERRGTSDTRNSERVLTLTAVVRSAITAVIAGMTTISVLSRAGVDTTPLLTGAGILGVAVGLGTQHLVRDLVAGVILLLENQFNVGDELEIAGVRGTVEDVTLRCVYLRDPDGMRWSIPSGEIKTLGNRNRTT